MAVNNVARSTTFFCFRAEKSLAMFDPGSARYGNFINYYSFNPPEKRLSLIPDNLLNELKLSGNVFALDVGCNSGVSSFGTVVNL